MEKIETFFERNTISILISLAVIMVCCFVSTLISSYCSIRAVSTNNFFILDENGSIMENGIKDSIDALEFGKIYLKNNFRNENCTYHLSECEESYKVYQEKDKFDFDGYYKYYPHAVIEKDGRIHLCLHRNKS